MPPSTHAALLPAIANECFARFARTCTVLPVAPVIWVVVGLCIAIIIMVYSAALQELPFSMAVEAGEADAAGMVDRLVLAYCELLGSGKMDPPDRLSCISQLFGVVGAAAASEATEAGELKWGDVASTYCVWMAGFDPNMQPTEVHWREIYAGWRYVTC